MSVEQHTPWTLQALNDLAALANSKGLAGGPYLFRGPFYECASEAEMLRLHHADFETTLPGGYAVRTDTNTVYQLTARPYSQLSSWTATSIPVVTSLPGGTPGQAVYLIGSGVMVRRTSTWESGRAYQVLATMRGQALARTQVSAASDTADRFVFVEGGANPERIVSRETATYIRNASTGDKFLWLDGQLKMARLSYLSGAPATVTTALRVHVIYGEVYQRTSTAYRARIRIRLLGSFGGRLQCTITAIGHFSGTVYEVLNSTLPYVEESGSNRRYYHIDAAWGGSEAEFDIEVRNPNGAAVFPTPLTMGAFHGADGSVFEYTVTGGGGGASDSIGNSFEAMAPAMPDPGSADENAREGMRMEMFRGRGTDPFGTFGNVHNGVNDWERVGGVYCRASGGGPGVWRAQPIGAIINGYIPDPTEPFPSTISLLANRAHEAVGTVTSAKVPRAIPRYPCHKAPDSLGIDSRLPRGVIRELIVTRALAAQTSLDVRIGWMDGGTFRELQVVSIAAGQHQSERIYPGWPVLANKSLAYEASENVSVVALFASGIGYVTGVELLPIIGSRITMSSTQMNVASMAGFPVSAFHYNDTERLLQSL